MDMDWVCVCVCGGGGGGGDSSQILYFTGFSFPHKKNVFLCYNAAAEVQLSQLAGPSL